MLKVSILLVGVLTLACESSSSSPSDETAGGASSDPTGGMNGTGDTGAQPEGGSNEAAAGSDGTGTMGGEPSSGGAPSQGEAGQTSASAGMPSAGGGDYAVSELDECKYSPDTCPAGPKPHYWECVNDPGVAPADGCELAGVNAVSSWCCPDPFCSSYAGATSLCEGLFPEAPNSFICALDTPGLETCKQPNPISLAQVYCCP